MFVIVNAYKVEAYYELMIKKRFWTAKLLILQALLWLSAFAQAEITYCDMRMPKKSSEQKQRTTYLPSPILNNFFKEKIIPNNLSSTR